MKISVQIDRSDSTIFQPFSEEFPEDIDQLTTKRFDGTSDLLQAIITLSGLTLPAISGIIIAQIRSRRHILVKVKGIEVSGLTEKTTENVLRSLLEKSLEDES